MSWHPVAKVQELIANTSFYDFSVTPRAIPIIAVRSSFAHSEKYAQNGFCLCQTLKMIIFVHG
ncbi:hypothetical protein [Sphingobacterium sp.]|uniref:hypothetical protein n=1 Tax=Sphingobacterium sp. TaxID=341027 RepID=UPI0028A70A18|nr:hypothetical protein [Sphingobacterium sp.]